MVLPQDITTPAPPLNTTAAPKKPKYNPIMRRTVFTDWPMGGKAREKAREQEIKILFLLCNGAGTIGDYKFNMALRADI